MRSIVGIVILCFVSVFSSTVFSQELSLKLTSTVRSQYVFGNGGVASDKPVVQTDLFVGLANGFWCDIWGSMPLDVHNTGKDYATELYATAGWTGKVGDYLLTLYVGYDDLHRTGTFDGGDCVAVVGEVSREFKLSETLSLSPFLHVETYFTMDGKTCGDTLPRLGMYYSWQIAERVSLDGKAYLLYDPGVFGGQTAVVGNIEGALHWKLSDNITFECPYVRYISPLNFVSDGRRGEWIYGAGISIGF